jgi:predicted phage replisome organizer
VSDNKKYYYLKVKENFFDSEQMIVLESMPDGYLYSNILLKLYLRSLKNEGKLMFNDRIPYNSTILSQVVRHSVGVVEKAIGIFKEFGLIDVMDNGAIYMLDIQNYIGQSSTEADRQRDYQRRISEDKGQLLLPERKKSNKKSNRKSTPEIEIEKKTDTEKEIKRDINTIPPKIEDVMAYCLERNKGVNPEKWFSYYTSNGWKVGKNPMKDWKAAVRTWEQDKPQTKGSRDLTNYTV